MKHETFQSLVKAILENNRMNDGKWSYWESVEHIEDIYGKMDKEDRDYKMSCVFLDYLSEHDGEFLSEFLDIFNILDYNIRLRN